MKDSRGYEVIEMNVQLVYAAALLLTAFIFSTENPKLIVVLMGLAAVAYGFATGWWAYGKYHGVF